MACRSLHCTLASVRVCFACNRLSSSHPPLSVSPLLFLPSLLSIHPLFYYYLYCFPSIPLGKSNNDTQGLRCLTSTSDRFSHDIFDCLSRFFLFGEVLCFAINLFVCPAKSCHLQHLLLSRSLSLCTENIHYLRLSEMN